MRVQPEYGWAACAMHGTPRPFVSIYSVSATRADVLEKMGSAHAMPGETWRQGWKRAYRGGWRAVRVRVEVFGS